MGASSSAGFRIRAESSRLEAAPTRARAHGALLWGAATKKAACGRLFLTRSSTTLSRKRERDAVETQTPTGLTFSTSILYCLIARATSLPVILPSLASASIAAWAM